MSISLNKTNLDAPAILEVVSGLSRAALHRYESLGVGEWAQGQAALDARKSIRCFRTFFKVHRLNCDFNDEADLLVYFSHLWLAGLFVPLAKWVTAHPLAQMAGTTDWCDPTTRLHAPLPAPPDWLPIGYHTSPLKALFAAGSKSVVQVLRTRLYERNAIGRPTQRARLLAWSLLGSKSMFPGLWVDQVGQSLKDHSALLTSEPPELSQTAEQVLTMIAESISRLSSPQPISYANLPRPRLSSSAGWVKLFDQETQRWTTMKGTRAAQYERIVGLAGDQAEELFSMDYRPTVGVKAFRQVPYQFYWGDWDFDPKVSVVALQEPFKIRTISIADGPATAAASPLQRLWHTTLKTLRPFSLIGGKRVADTVGDVFSFENGKPFVSGDYSAATDRLSMRATSVILRVLLKRIALPSELRDRLERSLMSSVLDYSRTLESFRGRVPDELLDSIKLPPQSQQTNGQLMGNILSFPILCLVNLSAWAHAELTSETQFGISTVKNTIQRGLFRGYLTLDELNNLPVLINGDDILFQASPTLYDTWLSLLPQYGFKPSMGKNYYSDEFFTINSELYTAQGFQTRPWWGAFETDLIRLRNEIKFETGEDVLKADMRRVLPRIQEFLRETVDPASWPIANTLWLELYHESGILGAYQGLNWFLPVDLGGVGLDPSGQNYFTTYAQKKLAIRMSLDPDRARRFLPSPEGSLISENTRRDLRDLYHGVYMTGDLVTYKGGQYVIHRETSVQTDVPRTVSWESGAELPDFSVNPDVLDGNGDPMVRLHPTVDTLVTQSKHLDAWLDHHSSGIRLSEDSVRAGVTRALRWGLRISDKRLESFESLKTSPRYLCSQMVVLASRADIMQ
jgi:hypothetical protein